MNSEVRHDIPNFKGRGGLGRTSTPRKKAHNSTRVCASFLSILKPKVNSKITLNYIRKNYNKLRYGAIKHGEKFTIFNFKERKMTDEKLTWLAFLMDRKKSKFFRKKLRWGRKIRNLIARKRSNIYTRCHSKGCHRYEYYGGRGIKCLITTNELEFIYHRDNAVSMAHASIDRINPNGHYEFSNCRFIELSENRKNRRKHGTVLPGNFKNAA